MEFRPWTIWQNKRYPLRRESCYRSEPIQKCRYNRSKTLLFLINSFRVSNYAIDDFLGLGLSQSRSEMTGREKGLSWEFSFGGFARPCADWAIANFSSDCDSPRHWSFQKAQ